MTYIQKYLKYIAVMSVVTLCTFFIKTHTATQPKIPLSQPQAVSQPSHQESSLAASTSTTSTSGSTIKPSVLLPGTTQKQYYLLSGTNDPYYSAAWYLQRINAPAAWATTTGSNLVVVADIDTGFALAHQDLSAHWRINSGESGGGKESDGVDNDANGYIDDWRGWDFVPHVYEGDKGDNNPQAGTTNSAGDGTTHGTETAGLIGAVGNNGVGTTAVSQNISIIPLQVIDDNGSGYSDDVASAIRYGVDNGADVINMSLGTAGDDPVVRAAIDYAYSNNVVVVAAAGNCGVAGSPSPCNGQPTGYITFPASYNRVLAVGATDSNNARANFSSYGDRLDVVAPGSGTIVSPTWAAANGVSAYATSLYGTSYASPIVASSVALVKSIRPTSTVDDLRALVLGGASRLTSMSGSFYTTAYGHGLLDVSKLVSVASDLNASEYTPELLQAGGVASEHSYGASDIIGSGCVATEGLWCSVWFRDDATNIERYLPYTKIGVSGRVGWSFSGSVLGHGGWEVRARSGNMVSDTPYDLFRK